MTPTQRKILILQKGFTHTKLAALVPCSLVELSHTIHERRPYPFIRKRIAELLKKSEQHLWGAEVLLGNNKGRRAA